MALGCVLPLSCVLSCQQVAPLRHVVKFLAMPPWVDVAADITPPQDWVMNTQYNEAEAGAEPPPSFIVSILSQCSK
jgi:hypothetical protein